MYLIVNRRRDDPLRRRFLDRGEQGHAEQLNNPQVEPFVDGFAEVVTVADRGAAGD